MIAVIIAGGSGTRLWPLSTPDYPKHLLKIASDNSLLRNTYERVKKLTDKIYVVTDKSHAHHVKDQLPELDDGAFIVEPARKGTANCLIAALEVVGKNHDNNEAISFISADHYIRDVEGFIHSFNVATSTSEKEKRIVHIGIEPDYPATGFGYIKKGKLFDEDNFVFNVDSFKEKPDYNTAKKYQNSGEYLWNCSYFFGSVNTLIKCMEEYAPKLLADYKKLAKARDGQDYKQLYLSFKSDTIEYALSEKAKNLLVVPASFDWLDLGSYNDIHHAVERDEQQNHVAGDKVGLRNVENAFVHNSEDKPVVVIGLDNVAVVNTPHGLLVTRKDQAQKVKDVLAELKQRDE